MRNGFTLIELLITIGLMGVLTVVILASVQGARCNSEDFPTEGCEDYIEEVNDCREAGTAEIRGRTYQLCEV